MATQVISFANNKGGSGKTTTCSNVGYALSLMGERILLVDGDMQMNLTLAFLGEEESLTVAQSKQNLYVGIKKEDDLSAYIRPTAYENLDLLPSSTLMSSMEVDLYGKKENQRLLKNGLQSIIDSGKYDEILIDSPPTLGLWVRNILMASDWVIIPVEASPWGLFGLANMVDFINEAKKENTGLELMGVLITKADLRKKYFRQTQDMLKELEEIPAFDTVICMDSQIEWAQDAGKPVLDYKKSSRSAKEYYELAKEVIQDGCRR